MLDMVNNQDGKSSYNDYTLPEASLEERVSQSLKDILDNLKISDAQIYTTLASTGLGLIKGTQQRSGVLIIVKASPRSYTSPTVPECQINVSISLSVMADSDADGHTYLRLVSAITHLMERWQRCLDDAHSDLSVDGLSLAGVVMGQGETSVDRDTPAWEYVQTMTIYGITSQS